MQARYYPKSDFLHDTLGTNPSYVWRSILETQEIVKQGCRKRIGDGKSTRVWHVPWLPCVDNEYLTSEMHEELEHVTVQNLFDDSLRNWDEEILQDLCNERDRKLIQQIPIPMRSKADAWFWILENNGEFSVRSCYRKIRGEFECRDRRFWKKLWSLQLSGKISNFLWRVSREVLPTTAALIGKNVDMDPKCAWCHMHTEDALHILFNCCFTRELWQTVGLQQLVFDGAMDTGMKVLKRVFSTGNTEQCVLVGLFCWSLWVRRNKWVWDKTNMSVFGVKAMALNLLADWNRVREKEEGKQRHKQPHQQTWCKPQEGWIKINVDAACRHGNEYVGVGCVVRDDRGRFVRARSNTVRGTMHAREAEAVSPREALSWTKDWRTRKCVFESDAKLLVDAIHGPKGKSYFDTIVEDCNELLKHFEKVLVVFVYRSANTVAHMIAQATYSMPGIREWYDTVPNFITCNLALDKS